MKQLERLRQFRCKTTGQVSTRFLEVLPRTVTIVAGYIVPEHILTRTVTLFNEVEVVPFAETVDAAAWRLYSLPAGVRTESRVALFDRLTAVLEEIVETCWAPGKTKLVLHSSGYDSRILSAVIQRVYERNGDDWLGDVLFACLGSEADQFKRIMQYQGWKPTQYYALKSHKRHYGRCLEFGDAWQWLNGPTRSPFNLNYVFVEKLQELGKLPEDDDAIQLWSGWGTDYALQGAGQPTGNQCGGEQRKSYSAVTALGFFKVRDVVYPYLNLKLLEAVVESSVRLGYGLRPALLRHLDPELAAFERVERTLEPLSKRQLEKAVGDYRESWYGGEVIRHAAETAKATMDGSNWWSCWTAAAFCEHLLEDGYEIVCL